MMDMDFNTISHSFSWFIIHLVILMIGARGQHAPIGCRSNVDLMILVDASESMIDNDPYMKPLYHWNRMKYFLKEVTRRLPISADQHRVALAKYSDRVDLEFHMGQLDSVDLVQNHLVKYLTHTGGNTNTANVLQWTTNYLTTSKRVDSVPIVLLFTDGLSNRETDKTKQRSQDLKQSGAQVYTISMGDEVDVDELRLLASSFGHVIMAPEADSSAWQHAINSVVYGICDLPIPTREPPICDIILDVALIIDNSGSIKNESEKNENYQLLKNFVKSLLDILDIAPGRTRVGALRFSTGVKTEFKLDSYVGQREMMKQHIDGMDFEGSRTNIAGALKKTREEIFNKEHGDRPDIQNVAIVIADGESNENADQARPEAQLLKQQDTRIYVVAVLTQKFNEKELKYIASDPDSDHYFVSPTIRNLPAIKHNLVKHICTGSER